MSNEEKYLESVSKWVKAERKRLKKRTGDSFFNFTPIPKPLNCFMQTENSADYDPKTKIIRQKCCWCGGTSAVKI